MTLRVFLGYDPREHAAYDVARKTAESFGCVVTPLRDDVLRACGLLTRPMDTRGGLFDIISGRSQSTRFALSRFAVPILAHDGWCLFADCDTLFLRDPHELPRSLDGSKAVYVVKHAPLPSTDTKMDGQQQVPYERKNWSSVALYNCSHPANRRLTLDMLNGWHRDDLHAFRWLHDSEIGELPPEWNWLVSVEDKPANPAIAHFTTGGPWLDNWHGGEYDQMWTEASAR